MDTPHLAPDLSPATRATLLQDAIACAGWTITRGRSKRRSYANPVTRRVVVRSTLDPDTPSTDLVALLAHEYRHVVQLGRPWWRRWGRGLLYLVSGVRRLCMELEAEAHEAAARYVCTGRWILTADSLSGWRSPYLTGATRAVVEAAGMGMARRLIR